MKPQYPVEHFRKLALSELEQTYVDVALAAEKVFAVPVFELLTDDGCVAPGTSNEQQVAVCMTAYMLYSGYLKPDQVITELTRYKESISDNSSL